MLTYLNPQFWLPPKRLQRKAISLTEYLLSIKISIATLIGISLYLTIYWLVNFQRNSYIVLLPLLAFFAFSSMLIIKKTGNKLLAGNLFLLGDCIYFYYTFVHGNGINSGVLIWIAIFPFIAILLTDDYYGQIWSSFFMSLIISSGIIIYWHGIDFHFYQQTSHSRLIQILLGLIILPYTLIYLVKNSYIKMSQLLLENTLLISQNRNVLAVIVHDTSHLTTKLSFLSHLNNTKQYTIEELKHKLQEIKAVTIIFDELISQARDMIAYKHGKKTITFTWEKAWDIYTTCKFCFNERLIEKEITLTTNINASSSPYIWTNKNILINNIINNLLSNAIKFSPENSTISLNFEQPDEDQVLIILNDAGIGIDADNLKNLLGEKTAIANQSTLGTNQEQGTGLGLPIVKKTLEFIHGTINITSQKNQGTRFYITLYNQKPSKRNKNLPSPQQ